MVFGTYADWLGPEDYAGYRARAWDLEKEVSELKQTIAEQKKHIDYLERRQIPSTETDRDW